jgi:phenylpropionate dioxygenase-like ring-hydroxylating dioxygenase large terminal subunit
MGEPLEAGETLRASWYTDPAVAAFEEERIFKSTWQYVGLTTSIPEPGDYFTYQEGRAPIVVVRNKEHRINGCTNVY